LSDQLQKYEDPIFNIVQEYLNQNRFFNFNDVIPFIQFRLKKFSINLNQTGIREVLKSLVNKKLIIEKSKFTNENVLENENRKRIYDYICENPGIYFNPIAQNLHLSNYILAWHIKILMNFNFIRSKVIENHEAFFEYNLAPSNDYIYFIISKTKAKRIIDFLIQQQNGASKTELSKELEMHSNTISNYIKSFEEYGLVLKKKLSRKTLYSINYRFYYSLINNSK